MVCGPPLACPVQSCPPCYKLGGPSHPRRWRLREAAATVFAADAASASFGVRYRSTDPLAKSGGIGAFNWPGSAPPPKRTVRRRTDRPGHRRTPLDLAGPRCRLCTGHRGGQPRWADRSPQPTRRHLVRARRDLQPTVPRRVMKATRRLPALAVVWILPGLSAGPPRPPTREPAPLRRGRAGRSASRVHCGLDRPAGRSTPCSRTRDRPDPRPARPPCWACWHGVRLSRSALPGGPTPTKFSTLHAGAAPRR